MKVSFKHFWFLSSLSPLFVPPILRQLHPCYYLTRELCKDTSQPHEQNDSHLPRWVTGIRGLCSREGLPFGNSYFYKLLRFWNYSKGSLFPEYDKSTICLLHKEIPAASLSAAGYRIDFSVHQSLQTSYRDAIRHFQSWYIRPRSICAHDALLIQLSYNCISLVSLPLWG